MVGTWFEPLGFPREFALVTDGRVVLPSDPSLLLHFRGQLAAIAVLGDCIECLLDWNPESDDLGDPCCDASVSSSSKVFDCQPLLTFTMA